MAANQDADAWSSVNFEIRSRDAPEALESSLRNAISKLNREASIEFRNFEAQVNDSMRQQEAVGLLSGFFGVLALLLAMIGLYGVTVYSVVRRQGEIGFRMALGAQKKAVVWLVMRDVVLMLGLGAVAGIAASLVLGHLVGSLLFGKKSCAPGSMLALRSE